MKFSEMNKLYKTKLNFVTKLMFQKWLDFAAKWKFSSLRKFSYFFSLVSFHSKILKKFNRHKVKGCEYIKKLWVNYSLLFICIETLSLKTLKKSRIKFFLILNFLVFCFCHLYIKKLLKRFYVYGWEGIYELFRTVEMIFSRVLWV